VLIYTVLEYPLRHQYRYYNYSAKEAQQNSFGLVRSRIWVSHRREGGRKEGKEGREREGLNLRERGLGTGVGTETFECNRRK